MPMWKASIGLLKAYFLFVGVVCLIGAVSAFVMFFVIHLAAPQPPVQDQSLWNTFRFVLGETILIVLSVANLSFGRHLRRWLTEAPGILISYLWLCLALNLIDFVWRFAQINTEYFGLLGSLISLAIVVSVLVDAKRLARDLARPTVSRSERAA
jgi:hypothetical protein